LKRHITDSDYSTVELPVGKLSENIMQ